MTSSDVGFLRAVILGYPYPAYLFRLFLEINTNS